MTTSRAIALVLSTLAAGTACAQEAVKGALLKVEGEPVLPVSRLDLPPDDLGLAGARLATGDNQTTGRFLGQDFVLSELVAKPGEAADALADLIDDGTRFIAVMADAPLLLELAEAADDDALLFNVAAPDDSLRGADCRANLLHMGPSRAMLADGLMQYLVWKQWTDLSMIHGSHPADEALAEAFDRAAQKFGARIEDTLVFEDTGGARRTDTGHVQVQRQMPLFTQDLEDGEVVLVADETEVFGAYVPFHTWRPVPVAGSYGLRPTSWHPALEAWGATQFQRRFEDEAGRYMEPEDYQAWLALRVLGEAASRTGSTDPDTLRDFVLGPDFELAGFKGQKLTFRPWNGQLRQPVLLAHDRLIVSVSPQEGFLHQTSLLDTLGSDEAENDCAAFQGGSE